jgi:uncharacterized protein Usg
MQNLIRHYRDVTGKSEVNMKDVAKFAFENGWKLPDPVSPLDRLAKEFSQAAREEIKHDHSTGNPYRVNHVVTTKQGEIQLHLWYDIDVAQREPMLKSFISRREQMVGDGLQLTFDADHWNNIHPEESPIIIPMDFTEDIEERKHAPVLDEAA